MKVLRNMAKMSVTELVFVWAIPIVLIGLNFIYWQFAGHNISFAIFSVMVPFIFASIVVSLATGVWRLWAWQTSTSIGNRMLPTIGVLWAGYTSLGVIILSDTIVLPTSILTVFKSGISFAIFCALLGTVYDMWCMHKGLLVVYNRPYKKGLGTVEIVTDYSLFIFGMYGLLYGLIIKIGHYYLVEFPGQLNLAQLLLGAMISICMPFLLHLYRFVCIRRRNALARALSA